MKITVDDIKEMVKESVRQIVESYGDYPDEEDFYRKHFSDEDEAMEYYAKEEAEQERQRIIDDMDYDAYVLVDESDGAILGNYTKDMSNPSYDPYMEAVNDAKQKESTNKFGDYSVYGCIDDDYDDDTLVYKTGDN